MYVKGRLKARNNSRCFMKHNKGKLLQWGALYSAGYIVRVPAIVRVKSLGTTWTPQ